MYAVAINEGGKRKRQTARRRADVGIDEALVRSDIDKPLLRRNAQTKGRERQK